MTILVSAPEIRKWPHKETRKITHAADTIAPANVSGMNTKGKATRVVIGIADTNGGEY